MNALSGVDVLKGDDGEFARYIAMRLFEDAAKARHDFETFFNFVMVEEFTKRPIKIAAHQKVAARFLQAHSRGVLMMPRGHSKSFLLLAMLLWEIGKDESFRGAVISDTQEQASKLVLAARQYIEHSVRLKLVFPHLMPSRLADDKWTQSRITINRPPGTRDPTLVAFGMNGPVLGSRLKWVLVDDILTLENVHTHEGRMKIVEWVDSAVLGTLDRSSEARAYLTGTAFHPEDLLHVAQDRHWATLKMDIRGNIVVQDDGDASVRVDGADYWDDDGLRLGETPYLRLKAHDPDPENEKILWPGKYNCSIDDVRGQQRELGKLIDETLPTSFQQNYMMISRDDAGAMFRLEWFDECRKKAREEGLYRMAERYEGQDLVFCGVDLGIAMGEHNDDTSIFTFQVRPDGRRIILDIDAGKFDLATKFNKLREKNLRYRPAVIMVESNGGQDFLVQMAHNEHADLPVKAVQTTAAKSHPEVGIPGFAMEFYRHAWLIPNAEDGKMHPHVKRFVRECVNYVPDKHTGDVLMSCVVPGARVTTARGMVPIEDVKVGDAVLTHKGRFRRVMETMCWPYKGEAKRLKATGTLPFTLTPEHPVWAANAKYCSAPRRVVPVDGSWDFFAAGTLPVGPRTTSPFLELPRVPVGKGLELDLVDYVPEARKHATVWWVGETTIVWPTTGMVLEREMRIEGDFAMLVGLYLAEGSIGGESHIVSFAFHDAETHLADFVLGQMKKHFDAGGRVWRGSGEHGVRVDCWTKIGARFFGEFGKLARKRVPWKWWWKMDQAARMQVMRGWLMGDGCYSAGKGTAQLSGVSISRDLLAQMQQAMWQEGMLPTLHPFLKAGPRLFAGKPGKCRDSWRLFLSQLDTRNLLGESNKLETVHWGAVGTPEKRPGYVGDRTNSRGLVWEGRTLTRLVKSETVYHEGYVHNLHVEEDNSYCVEGVAVHNSWIAWEGARQWGVGTGPQAPMGSASGLGDFLMR